MIHNNSQFADATPGETAAIAYSPLPAMAANLFSFAVPGFNGGETAALTDYFHRQLMRAADNHHSHHTTPTTIIPRNSGHNGGKSGAGVLAMEDF